jgi:hypothetical protein
MLGQAKSQRAAMAQNTVLGKATNQRSAMAAKMAVKPKLNFKGDYRSQGLVHANRRGKMKISPR